MRLTRIKSLKGKLPGGSSRQALQTRFEHWPQDGRRAGDRRLEQTDTSNPHRFTEEHRNTHDLTYSIIGRGIEVPTLGTETHPISTALATGTIFISEDAGHSNHH